MAPTSRKKTRKNEAPALRPPPQGVLVGCSGFAMRQEEYFRTFPTVEIQQTFYQPPQPETLARWREAAPPGFVFALKAWQLLTHEPTSPTYRRLREPIAERRLKLAGSLKWNDLTRRAWARTLEAARALDAEVILFQMPQSFRPEPRNIARIRRFFTAIEREERILAFEPRGNWDPKVLRELVEELDLVHAVDPFLQEPAGGPLRYFRLHGLPRYNYRYRFSESDLEALRARIDPRLPHRIYFNNISMAEDAKRFLALIAPRRGRSRRPRPH